MTPYQQELLEVLGTGSSNAPDGFDPTWWSDDQLIDLMHSERAIHLSEDDLYHIGFELAERLWKRGQNT